MEFFIPGLFLFLVAILITIFVLPKATPMIACILAVIFLTYGVYDHYKLFESEYNLSTWQDNLKIYSPALMIIAIIIFIIYTILAIFTNGEVPIPSMPNVSLPSANSITNSITTSLNNVKNSIANSIPESIANSLPNVNSSNINTSTNNAKKNNIKSNQPSRSLFETL
jgi:predicted PurR-regulated permease PerM